MLVKAEAPYLGYASPDPDNNKYSWNYAGNFSNI